MPIAVVQTGTHLSNSSGSSVTYTTSTRPTAGNFVALIMYNRRAAGLPNPTVTDNQGNTWLANHAYLPGATSGMGSSIYYVKSITMPNAGQLAVQVVSPDTVSYDMDFIELSGVDPVSPIRDTGSGTTTSTVTSLSINSLGTTAQVGDYVLATLKSGHTSGTANISGPTTGYTQIGVQQNASSGSSGQSAYKQVTTGGTQSASWTFSSVANHIGQMMVLRPAVPFIGLVQNSSRVVTGFSATSSYTTTLRPVAGNTLTIQGYFFAFSNVATNPTVSDNQGGAWTTYITNHTPGDGATRLAFIAVCNNITMPNAGQLTVTISGGGVDHYWVWSLAEWSNVATSSPYRATAQGTTATPGTSFTLSTDSTPQIGDLIIGTMKLESASLAGIVVPSGYSELNVSQDDQAENAGESAYKLVTVNGAQSTVWTYTSGALFVLARSLVLKPQVNVKVRALLDPSGANQSSLKVSIWYVPTGTDLHGANIGQYINQSSAASLDGSGNAVLDVAVGGGFPIGLGGAVKLLATNGTYTTGIIDGVVQ